MKTKSFATVALAALALTSGAAYYSTPSAHAGPASTATAQSIMVTAATENVAYEINGMTTWKFQRGTHNEPDTAMTFYSNAISSGPVVSCSGKTDECASSNAPTLSAPAASAVKLQQHAQDARCSFFFGGVLGASTYTDKVTSKGANGKGNWSYEWTYSITPTVAYVDPGTAWMSEETGGSVDISFSGFATSESFQGQGGSRSKYSFTMTDGGVSRARNMNATLQMFDGTAWVTVGTAADLNNLDTNGDFINDAVQVVAATADFDYLANAGTFGNSSVFGALHTGATGAKPMNNVADILTGNNDGTPSDNFLGNNNDLAAGNVGTAPFSNSFAGITQAGTYRILIGGTVKGNAGGSDIQVQVASNQLNIGGCTAQP